MGVFDSPTRSITEIVAKIDTHVLSLCTLASIMSTDSATRHERRGCGPDFIGTNSREQATKGSTKGTTRRIVLLVLE